ncbi:MAG: hypothetical protein U5L04_02130 [Trueperaceae bacterium]|nr:hypothetical protein [Trueperaceae bacterium]
MVVRDNGLSLYDRERQARRDRVERAFASFTQRVHPDMTREIVVSPDLYDLLADNLPDVLGGSLGIRVRLEPSLSGTVAHAIGTDGTRRHSFAMRPPGARLVGAPRQQPRRFGLPRFLQRLFWKQRLFWTKHVRTDDVMPDNVLSDNNVAPDNVYRLGYAADDESRRDRHV